MGIAPPLRNWPLLPVPDVQGRLSYPNYEDSVRQAIQIILRTRPGEQLMRPGFGAGLEDYLHEPNDLTTRRRIRDLILTSLGRWEPRITIDRLEVVDLPEQPSKIRVDLLYRLKRTGLRQNLRLTMDIGG